jgi:hypothetical protein
MPKYIIEREIPGAGSLTSEQLVDISKTSCGALDKVGTRVQWIESYVAGDKIYCIYLADNEELVRQHASIGGFPVNKIVPIRAIIDKATAEGTLAYASAPQTAKS